MEDIFGNAPTADRVLFIGACMVYVPRGREEQKDRGPNKFSTRYMRDSLR